MVSSSSVTMLMSCCMISGKPKPKPNRKKKTKALQKAIDEMNQALKSNAKYEKYFLDMAADADKSAREHAKFYDEDDKSTKSIYLGYLERKKICKEAAKNIADQRPPVVEEVILLESLKKTEIEALQDEVFTTQKTRHFCFLF